MFLFCPWFTLSLFLSLKKISLDLEQNFTFYMYMYIRHVNVYLYFESCWTVEQVLQRWKVLNSTLLGVSKTSSSTFDHGKSDTCICTWIKNQLKFIIINISSPCTLIMQWWNRYVMVLNEIKHYSCTSGIFGWKIKMIHPGKSWTGYTYRF